MSKLRSLVLIPALVFVIGVSYFLTHFPRLASKPAPVALAEVVFITPTPIDTLVEPTEVAFLVPTDIIPPPKTPNPTSTPTTRPIHTPTATPTSQPTVIASEDPTSRWPLLPGEPAEPTVITFIGTGDDVQRFTLADGGGLAELSLEHQGESNFIVQLLDGDGKLVEIFAYAVGEYEGQTTVELPPEAYEIDIVADGNWRINLTVTGSISQPDQPEAEVADLPALVGTPITPPSQ